MKLLAVIPARGGSTRVPMKNLQDVGGVPLVVRAMSHAAMAGFRHICVSTDHPGIAALAMASAAGLLDVSKRFAQPEHRLHVLPRLCGADGPMGDVIKEALDGTERATGETFDVVVLLQPTSPFRTRDDIIGTVMVLQAKAGGMSAVSTNETTGHRNGAVYVTRAVMARDRMVFNDDSARFPMHADRSIDINTPEDLERARRMAEAYGW